MTKRAAAGKFKVDWHTYARPLSPAMNDGLTTTGIYAGWMGMVSQVSFRSRRFGSKTKLITRAAGLLAVTFGCTQAKSVAGDELQLPTRLLGTWTSEGAFARFGELRLTAENISWADCVYEDYRVLRAEPGGFQIEILRPCKFGVFASFLIFELPEPTENASQDTVRVWICRGQYAFDQPPAHRFCSWGVLSKEATR